MEFVNQGVDAAKIASQHERKKHYAEAAYLYRVAAELVNEACANPAGIDAKLAADLPRYASQYQTKSQQCSTLSQEAKSRGFVPMLEDANVKNGLEAVRLAVDADNDGRFADAYEGYSTACRYLLLASVDERLSPADRKVISDKAAEYYARSIVISQQDSRQRLAAQGPLRSSAAPTTSYTGTQVPFGRRPGEKYVDPVARPSFGTRVVNAVQGRSEFGGTGVAKSWL